MHKIFVYGTLKRGYHNNKYCIPGATFVGEAVSTDSDYAMADGGFPIAWQTKRGGRRIVGEIFEITDEQFARCDRLEGHPDMYCRQERDFLLPADTVLPAGTVPDDQRLVKAWVYLWADPKQAVRYCSGRPRVKPNNAGQLEWNNDYAKIRKPVGADDTLESSTAAARPREEAT